MGNPIERNGQGPELPPVPQQQMDISEVPVPVEIEIKQSGSGFEYLNDDQFYLTFTTPNGFRYKIFFDEGGWQTMLDRKTLKKSNIVIAR